ncbi:hypothetical protein MA16_Dca015342 [Dendrobium catenatum]|uniref:Uncharacterized protein n=1 Tax=Dendrobium catenatum TaxID=906689 RepID=A0A2I0W1D2_9ASPA|nr:hypothetical protein MA16_Dca015342 [Dendrobium catenatum]
MEVLKTIVLRRKSKKPLSCDEGQKDHSRLRRSEGPYVVGGQQRLEGLYSIGDEGQKDRGLVTVVGGP